MKSFNKTVKVMVTSSILAFIVLILGIVLVIKSIDNSIVKYETENGKSIIQGIGEEAAKVKSEFNKGFNAETQETDTTKTFLKGLGEEVSKAKDEFNKGYKSETKK